MVTVGGVLKDQADADPDLSVKQRLVLAGGSTLEGASEFVPDEVGAGVLQVAGELGDAYTAKTDAVMHLILMHSTSACTFRPCFLQSGGVVKDQAEADENTNWQQRLALGVGG